MESFIDRFKHRIDDISTRPPTIYRADGACCLGCGWALFALHTANRAYCLG